MNSGMQIPYYSHQVIYHIRSSDGIVGNPKKFQDVLESLLKDPFDNAMLYDSAKYLLKSYDNELFKDSFTFKLAHALLKGDPWRIRRDEELKELRYFMGTLGYFSPEDEKKATENLRKETENRKSKLRYLLISKDDV